MVGTVMPPAAVAAAAAAGRLTVGPGQQALSPSYINSFRVMSMIEKIKEHLKPGNHNSTEFFNLCLSLARGIDYAVANNETLSSALELPVLMRQVCQRKHDLILQAAIMVLMISVKNACKIGWFKEKDAQELFTLADEVGRSFCTPGDIITLSTDYLSIISTIMSRFYPLMKMGNILASLVVKPGYGAHVIDFRISKDTKPSPKDKIHLFVAQADNTETSSCIISPQQVNFLLNGKGVEKRTSVLMDTGPQMPTIVTGMLKYGTNLLQAVGQFNGHYIIAIAYMSVMTLGDTPVLPEHVQPHVTSLDPDSELIEGPSRISLNCPISYSRIRTPVKGHSCNHHQCFDFSNFVDINTRRPSWRCPHCNQHVCYTDLRADQNMVKILRDVGKDVTEVIISADGSWRAVLESDDNVDRTPGRSLDSQKDTAEQGESSTSPSVAPLILDLTEDDLMDTVDASDIEDMKPLQTQIADEFWSNVFKNGSLDMPTDSGNSGLAPANTITTPVLTDAISPAFDRHIGDHGATLTSTIENSGVNEYGRLLQSHPHLQSIHRTPIAVQALPVPSPAPIHQTLRPVVNTSSSQESPSVTPATHAFNMSWNHQDHSFIPGQSVQQQIASRPTSNQPPVSNGPWHEFQNAHLQQALRVHPRNQSPTLNQSHSSLPRTSSQQGAAQFGVGNSSVAPTGQQGGYLGAAHRVAALIGRHLPSLQNQTSRPGASYSMNPDGTRMPALDPRRNTGGVVQAAPATDGLLDPALEQNWRPTGRMRGSLTGRAYSEAIRELMIQPTQPAQVTRPPTLASQPNAVPPGLQAMYANIIPPQSQNTPMTQPHNMDGNNGFLP